VSSDLATTLTGSAGVVPGQGPAAYSVPPAFPLLLKLLTAYG